MSGIVSDSTSFGSKSIKHGFSNQFRRLHGLVLTSGELASGLRDARNHMIPAALGQPANEDSHQFGLFFWIKLVGGVKDIGEDNRLTQGDLSAKGESGHAVS